MENSNEQNIKQKTYRNEKSAIITTLLLSIGAAVQAQDTTYDWVGGAPGYSGTIVLDSPSSAGGAISDIVSIDVSTPVNGSLDMDLSTAMFFLSPTFTWNSSQIIDMSIAGADTTGNFGIGVAENPPANTLLTQNFGSGQTDLDQTGSWVAFAVPDGGSTVWLFGAALAGLSGLRRFRK